MLFFRVTPVVVNVFNFDVLPNMSVLELDPGSSPAGITDKLIIDATTPVAPDNRGHYSQPVCDLPETKAWAEKLTAMLANRK